MEGSIYKDSDNVLEYSVNGNKERTAIVLLPPGIGKIDHFKSTILRLSKKYYVISIGFPGTGNSCFDKNNNVKGVATTVKKLLKKLDIKTPVLLGESYGGSVAIQLSRSIATKKIILIGTGEYFKTYQKIVLKILFYLPKTFPIFQRLYSKLLNKMHIMDLTHLNKKQLENITERWWEIIDFKLPNKIDPNTKAHIFYSDSDKILNTKSLVKLLTIYPNNQTFMYHCSHNGYMHSIGIRNYRPILKLIG